MVVRCDDIHSGTSSGFKRLLGPKHWDLHRCVNSKVSVCSFGARQSNSSVASHTTRDGNRAGGGGTRWGWRMGSSSPPPPMVLSCSIPAPPRPTPHDGENFLTPSLPPLRPHKVPPYTVKLYFLLICPTISTIFLMKPISLIKIYLKLQLNLSHQMKSIFRKNWIIYLSV